MLKSYIAKKSFGMLFDAGASEFKMLFASPQSLPSDFNWRLYWDMLRSNSIKTIGIDQTISIFYVLRPELKPAMHPHTRFLGLFEIRSVHAILQIINDTILIDWPS
ncbi:MAG: hypothetical protein IPH59_01395 [bacterium]|nr:hypothetical protein [bacterium]